jgi:hypothetical protein
MPSRGLKTVQRQAQLPATSPSGGDNPLLGISQSAEFEALHTGGRGRRLVWVSTADWNRTTSAHLSDIHGRVALFPTAGIRPSQADLSLYPEGITIYISRGAFQTRLGASAEWLPLDLVSSDMPEPVRQRAQSVLNRLREFARLEPDWDGYGAARVSKTALARAKKFFLDAVYEHVSSAGPEAVPSFVAPIADGGVQLEWERPGVRLEIEISAQGVVSYLLVQGAGPDAVFEERHDVSSQDARALVGTLLGTPRHG